MNLYFNYESCDNLKSFCLFLTVKTITKLNLAHSDKFKIELKKLAVMVHVLRRALNLVISRCCFAEDGKEMFQDLQRTCKAIVLFIKPFV